MSEPTPEAIEAALAPAVNAFRREMKESGILTSLHPTVGSMRAALTAAAPFLIREAQAQALEDAAEVGVNHARDVHYASTLALMEFTDWLRRRAAAIRDGAV
jgi:hypothetical protein